MNVKNRGYQYLSFAPLICLAVISAKAQEAKYPPLSEYMMPQADEVALAKSAAPQSISEHATIRVFTASGYQTVHEGDNGFVCMVMRGFTGAPTSLQSNCAVSSTMPKPGHRFVSILRQRKQYCRTTN